VPNPADHLSRSTEELDLWAKGRSGNVFLIFAALLFLCVQALLLPLPYIEADEAVFGACAVRQLSTELLPLTNCVDIKPPGIFSIYELIYAIFGHYSGVGLRLFAAAAVIISAVSLAMLTQLATNRAIGKTAAAIFIFIASSSYFILALKTEMVAVTCIQLALIFVFKFKNSGRLRMLVAAGIFVGLSALFKQPAIIFGGAIAVALYFIGPPSRRTLNWVKNSAIFGSGAVASLSILVLIYVANGHFQDFVQQMLSRPALYAAHGPDVATALHNLMRAPRDAPLPTLLVLTFAAFAALATIAGRRTHYLRLLKSNVWWMGPSVVCACVVTSLGGRFFPSYFIFLLPFTCIALAIAAQPVFDAITESKWVERAAVFGTGLAAVIILMSMVNLRDVLESGLSDREPVLAQAQPGDKLYVWGYMPEFYASTKLTPASRFVVTSLLVGHFFEDSIRTAPEERMKHVQAGDWDLFLQDLRQTKSFLFIDASSQRMGKPGDFAPARYPRMQEFLDAHCTFKRSIGPMPLYRCGVNDSDA
jgi:hypothetical protein